MKSVLFVCVHNSCRSQMAEGFARSYGADKVMACSAGSRPSGVVDSGAIKVMGEVGIDISDAASNGFDDLPKKEFDYVVTMGCGDACPFVPARKNLDWDIMDPKGKGEEFFRKVRDQIGQNVRQLIKEDEALL